MMFSFLLILLECFDDATVLCDSHEVSEFLFLRISDLRFSLGRQYVLFVYCILKSFHRRRYGSRKMQLLAGHRTTDRPSV
jgi:hypothetical protein